MIKPLISDSGLYFLVSELLNPAINYVLENQLHLLSTGPLNLSIAEQVPQIVEDVSPDGVFRLD